MSDSSDLGGYNGVFGANLYIIIAVRVVFTLALIKN